MINYQFKVLLSIAIILVVFGHTGVTELTLNRLFPVDTFHMALFLFISGYFYRNTSDFIIKKIKRLLVPYIIWCIIYGLLINILKEVFHGKFMGTTLCLDNALDIIFRQLNMGDAFGIQVASWFIVMLFFCSITYHIISSLIKQNTSLSNNYYKADSILLLGFLILCILSITIARCDINFAGKNFFCRLGYALFFYHLGFYYNKYLEKYDTISGYKYFFIVILVQTILYFVCKLKLGIVYNSHYNNDAFITILLAINGIALWLRISRYVTPPPITMRLNHVHV